MVAAGREEEVVEVPGNGCGDPMVRGPVREGSAEPLEELLCCPRRGESDAYELPPPAHARRAWPIRRLTAV